RRRVGRVPRPRPLVPRADPSDSVRVVGEFGVIARVLAQAGTARAAEVGPGDDAAVLRTTDGRVVATAAGVGGRGPARSSGGGPGGAAAVLRTPDGRVVATVDVLVEGRHFRRDWS